DKIINRARDKGVNWKEMAEEYIKSFNEDMEALNCLAPTHSPRATEYISQMLEDVTAILNNGYAYAVDGDVYFDVEALKSYGKLSHRELEDREPGARVVVDDRKKNPADFALWKAAKPDEPSWPSPWGPGRPGWHIECSTMSARLLGPSFDIHGGGQDLVFPHHENELAQSAALGRPMANIWAHNGFVNINNEKMSKSLGNTFNVKDIFKCFPPEVLRFFLISSHYRGPIDFSDEALKEASRALERIYRTLEAADSFLVIKGFSLTNPPKALELQEYTELSQKFSAAMDDDLNTSKALGHLFELVHLINRLVTENEASKVYFLRQLLWAMGEELGLRFKEPKVFLGLLEGIKLEGKESLKVSLIEEKVAQRNEARSNKDWAKADLLRKELSEMGVTLEDRGGATSWRFT
ncbi:MAG: cysteine--tRNA ligase, partial [Deltaproteobacteria bacterium]|nr:cysteine--tRNA ligase [Deltaproteobacteria bacterium]